jgi:M6 family metalloprotease-like protein
VSSRRIAPLLISLLLAACGGSSHDNAPPQQTALLSSVTTATPAKPVASDYNNVVQQIYVAYFGRPADVGGLDWHAKVLLAAGAPTDVVALSAAYDSNQALKDEIDSFGTSAESAALYPGDNGQFVDALYQNLFGRAPDAAGKQWWVGLLDRKVITRASAAIQITAGAQKADATIIGNKTNVASTFTSQITTDVQQKGYDGLAANVVVRTMLGKVGETTDLTAFNSTVRSTVSTLTTAVATANGWQVTPLAPAINSVSAVAPAVLTTVVTANPNTAPPAPPVPTNLAAAPAGANLKLWTYDPRSTGSLAIATGIFLQNVSTNSSWQFVGANGDGSLYLTLAAGNYQFDTVEPNGMASVLLRHRYQVSVTSTGAASIKDLTPTAAGIYPVTLDLAVVPASAAAQKLQADLKALAAQPTSTFKPTSLCQMMDQVTPNRSFSADISAGFPKVRTRLKSYGHIKALIIPVDFPNVNGVDSPGTFFTPLAKDMRDFYLSQSYGRLAFDFEILPNWVRMPFNPSKYGFTNVNGSGDFATYRSDIFAMLDKQIDFSQYDAVYILVPKEMPMSQMGYGPAITSPSWTSTGYVINGATGGADMYNNIPGAQWKWMAHETGHAFGLYDEDLNHASQTLGFWSLMAMNWSVNAIEHNSWDRYLQGWLPEEQVACLPKTSLTTAGTTVALGPLERQNTATKSVMVPLTSSKILVMESRKNEGYDHIVTGHEGVLVYTVDMTIGTLGGGYRTQRRPGSTDPNFEDAALHVGDTITVEGVTVMVTATSADGDTVKVTKP